ERSPVIARPALCDRWSPLRRTRPLATGGVRHSPLHSGVSMSITASARRWRRPTSVLAAALLVAASLTIGSAPASAADPLISQGKPTLASSTENAGTPASAAVDGNTGTRWSSQFSDPQWIRIDLGATATVTQVVLNWETAYARAYQIQVSA